MWQGVKFKAEFNCFEFRVFLLLHWLPNWGWGTHSAQLLPIAGGRIRGLIPFPRVLVLCELCWLQIHLQQTRCVSWYKNVKCFKGLWKLRKRIWFNEDLSIKNYMNWVLHQNALISPVRCRHLDIIQSRCSKLHGYNMHYLQKMIMSSGGRISLMNSYWRNLNPIGYQVCSPL